MTNKEYTMKKIHKIAFVGMFALMGLVGATPVTAHAQTPAVIEKNESNTAIRFQPVYLRSGVTDTLGLGAYQNIAGSTYQYSVGNYYEDDNERYEAADTGSVTPVVSVDANGKITTNMVGTAKVKVTIRNSAGVVTHVISIPVVVSDPSIKESKIAWKVSSKAPFIIEGITSESKIELLNAQGQKLKDLENYEKRDEAEFSDEENVEVHNEILHYCEIDTSKKRCESSYIISVDGVRFPVSIVTTKPKLKENQKLIVLKKGKKATLHFSGIDDQLSKIECNDYGADIAKCTDNKVVGKTIGTGQIEIQVDGENFLVTVSVQKGKVYKAVKYAAKQIGVAKYSQAKRNKKGYYDCSSLVWRAYKAAGIRIGKSKYPLNSDGLAKAYYKKKGHWVGKNLKNLDKLRSGDIIIRGRMYKGHPSTDHAALYIGNGYTIEAKNEQYGITLWRADHADIAVRPVK